MSKMQFLTFPGHPVKFNYALVMSVEKGEVEGPNMVISFVDGRVSVIRFKTSEERDDAFDKIGSDPISDYLSWALECQEWLKDNPLGSPLNPFFKAHMDMGPVDLTKNSEPLPEKSIKKRTGKVKK